MNSLPTSAEMANPFAIPLPKQERSGDVVELLGPADRIPKAVTIVHYEKGPVSVRGSFTLCRKFCRSPGSSGSVGDLHYDAGYLPGFSAKAASNVAIYCTRGVHELMNLRYAMSLGVVTAYQSQPW